MPFREDFAQSCNTAFVSLADRLGRDDLTAGRAGFGLGERLDPGAPAVAADVPPPRDAVGKAAMLIGQDRIVASPLAMAGVAATVADGRWRAPRLLAGAPRAAGPPLDAGTLATLRELMRAVVTVGHGHRAGGRCRARCAARAARRSTAAAIRPRRTPGSSRRATTWRSRCSSRAGRRAARSPRRSPARFFDALGA